MIEVINITDWSITESVDLFILCLFVLSFCYVQFFRKDISIRIASAIYSLSYLLSFLTNRIDFNGLEYFASEAYYLNWALYDTSTVLLIFFAHMLKKVNHQPCVSFAYLMSIINMFSYLTMHYLAFEVRYQEHWFYYFYSLLVNFTAIVIAFSLALKFRIVSWLRLCTLRYL